MLVCNKSKVQLFIFGPLSPGRGTLQPQRCIPNSKAPTALLGRVPFCEKRLNFKIIIASLDSKPNFLLPWAKIKKSAPNYILFCHPDSQKVLHNPLTLKPWEEIDLTENLTPWTQGSDSRTRKLLARSKKAHKNLTMIRCPPQKSCNFFTGYMNIQVHRHTFSNRPCTTREIIFFHHFTA